MEVIFDDMKGVKCLLHFCKIILCLKKSTCNVMVYRELGRCILLIATKMRIMAFWAS